MIPFLMYALVAVIIAFAGGFYLGNKKNHQSARIGDSVSGDVMSELGEKGRKAQQERIEKRKALIMKHTQREGRITNNDVEDLFCISDATSRNYLNELEHDELLTQHGTSGRGVFYTPINNQQETKHVSLR